MKPIGPYTCHGRGLVQQHIQEYTIELRSIVPIDISVWVL